MSIWWCLMRHRWSRPVCATAFVLLLAGCGHMPVTSMVRLARIDLQTTDPGQLRVAIKVPNTISVRAEGTVLRIAVKLADGTQQSRDFSLRAVNDGDELRTLAAETTVDSYIAAFALTDNDVMQLRLFRAGLIRQQKSGSGGAITISVRPNVCRVDELAAGPVLFTSYLRTAETGDYVPLARDLDLYTIDGGRDIAASMPRCKR